MIPVTPTWRRWPLRRFVVADHSMEPALAPGDALVATPYGRVRLGQLRCLPDPLQRGRWLVKRVSHTDGGRMRVASDNALATTVDSDVFGPVPIAGTYRVLLRIPVRLL